MIFSKSFSSKHLCGQHVPARDPTVRRYADMTISYPRGPDMCMLTGFERSNQEALKALHLVPKEHFGNGYFLG